MRQTLIKLLPIMAGIFFISHPVNSQNGFQFNCTRDTVLAGCDPNPCINLQAIIPDIHGLSTSYVVNPIPSYGAPCFPVYSSPNIVGTPTFLVIDDTYSATINIGFPFHFFGTIYNQLIASTNGVVSFDISNANQGAEWQITNGGTPVNLPSTFYDRALVMGPYHDLNPNISQPTQRIQYVTVGAAPHRKWILSFYRVPLFSCTSLIENTHQIILYESTGMVEVLIFSKQICTGWNQGRAMVGMQNFNRDQAIMAPGRRASDNPWGSINMNETWRFVPSAGPSLFQRVELIDLAGNLISTGTTTSMGNGNLAANFSNICPVPGLNTYIVRSVYTKIDDPNVQIYGMDTIRVTKSPPSDLGATASSTETNCGPPTGTITVNVPTGTAPFTYVLDGGTPQTGASPFTFSNVSGGPHNILVTDASGFCSSFILDTVGVVNNLAASVSSLTTTCPNLSDGTINVTPTTGSGPYTFTLTPGNIVQSGATASFTGLAAGSYTVAITDATGCTTIPGLPAVVAPGPGLAATATSTSTACLGGNSGTVTVTPTSGTAPYTFVLNGTVTQTGSSTTFTNLPAGTHTISVTDASGCTRNPDLSVTVASGPALSTSAAHTDALCNGSSTGTITVSQPAVGSGPFEYSLDGSNWQASNTFPGLPAGTYTVYFRDGSGCQGQLSQTIAQPAALGGTASALAAICNGQNNGSITVSGAGGVTPYEYSIDGGSSWQSGNTFNVGAGTYTVTIRDANQCITTQSVTVTEPAGMMASATTTNATCNGGNDGSITLSASGGNTSYEYSLDGNTYQPSAIFNVPPGTYTGTIRDNLGCTVTVPGIVVDLTNDLSFAAPSSPTICEGSSTQLSISTNAQQYSWTPAAGLDNPYSATPLASPTSTTTYTASLTYGRCAADVPVTVNVNAAPIPNAGADGYICYGQTYQLQGSGGVQYTWSPSAYLSADDVSNPVSTPDRTMIYALSVVDANGCPSLVTDEVKVDLTPPIHVSTYPFDTVVYAGDQFPVLATSVATDYLWSPATGLSDPNIANPTVTAGQVGDVIVYKVTAYTQAGCKGEGYVRVRVYEGPEIYVPTAFTPNGDGRNDRFFPFPVGIKSIKYFRVFNRWGQLMFSTSTLHDGWDGKFGGVEQASGVYVWVVEGFTLDDRLISHKGTVTLIR